ncbi:hypothetical protein Plhal703r1_c03g0018311 [Plasmopara halstedii]
MNRNQVVKKALFTQEPAFASYNSDWTFKSILIVKILIFNMALTLSIGSTASAGHWVHSSTSLYQ